MRLRLVRRLRRAASPSVSCPSRSVTRMWAGRRSARCRSVRRLMSRRVLCLIPRRRPGRPAQIVCRPGRSDRRPRTLRHARMRLPPRRVSGPRTSSNARFSGVLPARRLVDHHRVGRHRLSRQRLGWRSCKRFLKNAATSHRRAAPYGRATPCRRAASVGRRPTTQCLRHDLDATGPHHLLSTVHRGAGHRVTTASHHTLTSSNERHGLSRAGLSLAGLSPRSLSCHPRRLLRIARTTRHSGR